jgi:multidrug resistance efflux pump
MENSIYYNTKAIHFIVILNRILLAFVALVAILIFALDINDTVPFKDGQIFSDTPQLKINAPNDVRVSRILVREGQHVRKGDTLMLLDNKKTVADREVLVADIAGMENKVVIFNQLIANTEDRKKALEQLLGIQSKIYRTDRTRTAAEIAELNNKLAISNRQNAILADKYKTDSLLYAKGAISKYEMTEAQTRDLTDKKGAVDARTTYKLRSYDYVNLYNNNKKTRNDLRRSIIDVDNTLEDYRRQVVDLDNQIKDKKAQLAYMNDEMAKMTVTAPFDGTISNLFNARQNQFQVAKGDLLAIVAPDKERFYAKVTLDEKDLAYIRKGQMINLKLDAYNYYRYGAIKGKITYVSPSDVDKTFYCLATIYRYNPNINLKAGYKLRGEVIVEEMPMYQYIMKKLFNKIDGDIH